MQITGKLVQIFDAQTGTGKSGEWRKRAFLLESEGQYPKIMYIMTWGDKINLDSFSSGQALKVDFDAESREYNGKWYTELRAWRVEIAGSESVPIEVKPPIFNEDQAPLNTEEDDIALPF
jgi:hypothetical protein